MDTTDSLGSKIRSKRVEKGMNLKDLADAIGKTSSFLSQVERGLAEPSITSLRKISEALDVPIFYFLLSNDQPTPVVRRNQRKVFQFPGYSLTFELLSPDLSRQIEMIMGTLEPGGVTCEEPLPHSGEECTLVLKGQMEIIIGGDVYHLEEGDSIYYFGSIPHKITNTGGDDLVFLSAISPPSF